METPRPRVDDRYADLAEVVLAVAREIRIREYASAPDIALTPSHAGVMRYVDANPGSIASEVADATGLKRSNLSTTVRQLEAAGLIERREDPIDGRAVRLYPTPVAAATRRKIRREWSELLSGALGSLDGVNEATTLLGRVVTELTVARRDEASRGIPS